LPASSKYIFMRNIVSTTRTRTPPASLATTTSIG
jgi:hypothetical protein